LGHETGEINPRAEALLYAADRAHHVGSVIRPALARGEVVITDRYFDSSIAYQGAGRVLIPSEVARISRWATETLYPTLTVLIDVPAVLVSADCNRVIALKQNRKNSMKECAKSFCN
jgi:dTMP kinase